jgi:hypothetical protein
MKMKTKIITTQDLKQSISRSPLRVAFLLIPLTLVCLALSPRAQAVLPPPDGGYSGANTAEGQNALLSLSIGSTGHHNTAVGFISLGSDAAGSYNTAIGAGALLGNTADENTATGFGALLSNSTGVQNTANGAVALFFNTTGNDNTAIGDRALQSNTIGGSNTANGTVALFSNTTGETNVAIGDTAMFFSNSDFNTAVGFNAGSNLTLTTSSENIYIGDTAGTVDFLGSSPGDEAGVIRIGSFFSGFAKCFINGILPNVIPQNPGNTIVTRDPVTGQLGNTTDFAANKVVEQQKKIEEQQASISQLKSEMQTMVAQLKEQAAQIQKVSARLQVNKPAPQIVNNP